MKYWLIALLCFMSTAAFAAGPGIIPPVGEDLSAYRIDSDVFGWNKEFTEFAALSEEVRRFPLGRLRGKSSMLVFRIGSTIPIHNVYVMEVTAGDHPNDPAAIPDCRDNYWKIDTPYQKMWPIRPKLKYYKGAMTIEPQWTKVEISKGSCRPAVAFILGYQGKKRYQAPQLLELRAPCDLMRLTDTRTYWGRNDIGAVMMRFDYSPTEANEQSMRIPIAAAWRLAKPVRIAAPKNINTKKLAAYGDIELTPAGSTNTKLVINFKTELEYLAQHIAEELGATLGAPLPATEKVDLKLSQTAIDNYALPLPAVIPPDSTTTPKAPPESGYLNDWTVK